MNEQHEHVTTVNAIVDAVTGGDHGALAKIFTDDVAFHVRGPGPTAGDHEGIGGLLEALGGLMESAEDGIDLEQQFCIGADGWAAEFEHATLHRKDRTLESRNAFVYRFDGGRIDEMWMFLGARPDQAEAFFA